MEVFEKRTNANWLRVTRGDDPAAHGEAGRVAERDIEARRTADPRSPMGYGDNLEMGCGIPSEGKRRGSVGPWAGRASAGTLGESLKCADRGGQLRRSGRIRIEEARSREKAPTNFNPE